MNLNGTRAYYKKNDSQNLFVFYHGNAGSACDRVYLKDYIEKPGFSYIVAEYTGYSNDERKPSKELIMKDIENINEFVNKQSFTKVIISGESLGASLAVYHSTLVNIDKMLLISPFYSLKNIAKRNYGIYPISLLSTENFDSSMWMKNSQANEIEIIHGTLDEIVPVEESKKLFNEIKIANKKFVEVPNAHHNDIYDFNETNSSIQAFLEE
ncbi:alpha/beta hydrolase [Patescibacteria group bacterium]|nr:alpha/beta hydrolase [Patescibacteria group bacterium]